MNMKRFNEDESKWELSGSIYVWELILRREISHHAIAGWRKKNEYERRRLIRRI